MNKNEKYGFIDSLRGFAILGVILVHTSQWVVPSSNLLKIIAANGSMGVQLFFVVSALTLFMSMKSRFTKENKPVRNFFIRRFFRIAPMFYAGIIVYTLVYGFSARYWAPNGITWLSVGLTSIFMHGWHPETINSVVPGGWSIAVEVIFYLTLPYLFKFIKDYKDAILFILASLILGVVLRTYLVPLIYSPLYPETQMYLVDNFANTWFFSQLPVFGVGILLFFIFDKYKDLEDKKLGYVLLSAALVLFLAFLKASTYHSLLPSYFLYGIAFGVFSLGVYFSKLPILDNFLIRWIGKLSFSIYIVHFGVFMVLRKIFTYIEFPGTGDFGLWIALLIVLFLSSTISFVTYKLIEEQGIKLGKRIIEKG